MDHAKFDLSSHYTDLEESLPLMVVGHEVVPPAKLIILGQVIPAHDSEIDKSADMCKVIYYIICKYKTKKYLECYMKDAAHPYNTILNRHMHEHRVSNA